MRWARRRQKVTDPDGDLAGKAPGEAVVALFVLGRAAAKEDELHSGAQHFGQCAELDVHAFLFGQPGNGAKERNGGFHGQAEEFLQLEFIDFFTGDSRGRIRIQEMGIARGLPFAVIDAVKDAEKVVKRDSRKGVRQGRTSKFLSAAISRA